MWNSGVEEMIKFTLNSKINHIQLEFLQISQAIKLLQSGISFFKKIIVPEFVSWLVSIKVKKVN